MTGQPLRVAPLLPLELTGVGYEAGGKRLIRDVTLSIAAGPRTVILGPNGAGKSLLLRLCHGLLRPTSGTLRFSGPESVAGRRRHAMVFQRPMTLRRSVIANVSYGLALAGVSRRDQREAAMGSLERVGLAALADRPARVLSGGEQQRLALARAWALQPEVLFLDEPTANLDPSATQAIEAAIQAIHAAGTKIVLVTHNLGQAHRLGDEVLFMASGRVIEQAGMEKFLRSPASPEASQFIRGELPWS
jgi:tungstate transport system ATP-binding protein